MTTGKQDRDAVYAAMKEDIPGFDVVEKSDTRIAKFIDYLMNIGVLRKGGIVGKLVEARMGYNTFLYPRVFLSANTQWDIDAAQIARTLEHEWVHAKDAQTFFGALPKRLRFISIPLFYIVYAMPQLLAALALLAPFTTWWWLLALLFLAPVPAPIRAVAELRAYRRSLELGGSIKYARAAFLSRGYWWMLPFPGLVERLLQRPSPYKSEMDAVR